MRAVALLVSVILVGFGPERVAVRHMFDGPVEHGVPVVEEVALWTFDTTDGHQAIFKFLLGFNSTTLADVGRN